jgi:nickel-dependent lactate racemase
VESRDIGVRMSGWCIGDGAPERVINTPDATGILDQMLAALGPLRRVLLIPPDITRRASGTGVLTTLLYERLAQVAAVEILPALGTHAPLTAPEQAAMFPGVPATAFRVHDWRRDQVHLGEAPATFVRDATGGRLDFAVPCEVNRRLLEPWDCIISLGQVVPHEVAGMAGHAKNIFIGVGGRETIHRTHYIGAVCGMERALGRVDTPVRRILNEMTARCAGSLPICHVLTVRGPTSTGEVVTRGLFAGNNLQCFERAAALAASVNITLLDAPVRKMVVQLDPTEFRSTWLGNKAIYRTRLALADDGELVILAPGVCRFGEDAAIDRLIRRHGYRGTPEILRRVADDAELGRELAAAAHLIHGSSEGRFRVTYCPGGLTRAAIEAVGYEWGDLAELRERYAGLSGDGWRETRAGERVYFISNPAQGLWALRSQFAPAAKR